MKKSILMILGILMISSVVWGANHWTESFENPDSWSGYTTGTVNFDSGDWDFVSVYPEDQVTNIEDGTKACRINDDIAGASITAPAVNSVGTVTFYYHRPFGGTGTLSLQKSVGGGGYTELTTQNFDDVTTPTEFTYAVNDVSDNIRIRVVNDNNTAHLTIDYMIITDYSGSADPEPTNHVTGFTVTKDGYNKIDISWTANDGAQAPAGYLIKASTADNVSDPVDGTVVADNATIGSDSGAKNISHGTNVWEWTELSAETQYYFKIYPYTNSGADIDYKTDGTVPSENATTDVEPEAPTVGDLYITEVCGDGADTDASNDNGFMEIYNNSDHAISLANVQARYYNTNPGTPSQTVTLSGEIASDGYVIVTQNEANFNTTYTPVTADFAGSNFYFNGGDDGCDIYYTTSSIILDKFNDNGSGQSPWDWEDNNTWERSSTSDGGVKTNWTENTTGNGSPKSENATPLPVTLTAFTAIQIQNEFVQINWTVESESGLSGYFVYREIAGTEDMISISNLISSENLSYTHDYQFIDDEVEAGNTYDYYLEAISLDGSIELFGPASINFQSEDDFEDPNAPLELVKLSNYPNPFNPTTTIVFSINEFEENRDIHLNIYNVKGQKVRTLFNEQFSKGNHEVVWNGKDDDNKLVSSGIYYSKLFINGESKEMGKLLMMK